MIGIDLIHTPNVWFYFQSENVSEVEWLLGNVHGLGKKVAHGYGAFSSFQIEESDFDFDAQIVRPIPISMIDVSQYKNTEIRFQAWHYPYWDNHFVSECIIKGDKI